MTRVGVGVGVGFGGYLVPIPTIALGMIAADGTTTITGTYLDIAPVSVVIAGAGAVTLASADIIAGGGTISMDSIVVPANLVPGIGSTSTVTITTAGGTSNVIALPWHWTDLGVGLVEAYDPAFKVIETGVSQLTGLKNGRHLLQATAGAQPAWIAEGSPSGKPVLRFNGTSHFLKTNAFAWNQPALVLVAAKMTIGPAAHQYLCDGNGGNTLIIQYTSDLGGHFRTYSGATFPFEPQPSFDAWYVWEYLANGSSSANAINGAVRNVGAAGAANPGGFTLGQYAVGGLWGKFDEGRALLMNRDFVDASERANAVAWVNASI